MNKFYITFGQNHAHRVNKETFDKDCVGTIEANTEGEAREIAFELFGDKFFTTYSEENWDEDEQMQFFPRGYLPVNHQP